MVLRFKKAGFVLLLALLLIMLGVVAAKAAAGPMIRIDNAAAAVGESLVLPVRVENNPGITSFALKATYDESALTLTHIQSENGLCAAGGMFSGVAGNGRIVWLGDGSQPQISTDGVLFYLHFSIQPTAAGRDLQLALTALNGAEEDILGTDGVPLAVTFAPGTVQVAQGPAQERYPFSFELSPADATLQVWNSQDQLQNGAGGVYQLPAGSYRYLVSKNGYTSQSGNFTLPGSGSLKVTLQAAPSSSPYLVSLSGTAQHLNAGDTFQLQVIISGADNFTNCDLYLDYPTDFIQYLSTTSTLPNLRAEALQAGQVYLNSYGDSQTIAAAGLEVAVLKFRVKSPLPLAEQHASLQVNAASAVGNGGSSQDALPARTGPAYNLILHNLTVQFAAAAGCSLSPVTAYVKYNQPGFWQDSGYTTALPVPVPTAAAGYRLAEPLWSDGQNGYSSADLMNATFTEPVTLTAQALKTWTARFYVGSSQLGAAQTVDAGQAAQAPANPQAPLGHSFAGWFVAATPGASYNNQPLLSSAAIAAQALQADVIYQAHFSVNRYGLHYDPESFAILSGTTPEGKASYGTDLNFKLQDSALGNGYALTVSYRIGSNPAQEASDKGGVYTIPGTEILGEVSINAGLSVDGEVKLIRHDAYHAAPLGYQLLQIIPREPLKAGMNYYYAGAEMFWSGKYSAFVYFVPESVTEEIARAQLTVGAGQQIVLDYNGDINQNGRLSSQDSQIIYMLYTGMGNGETDYLHDGSFSLLSMRSRLEADVNGDGVVDTLDARAVQSLIFSAGGNP